MALHLSTNGKYIGLLQKQYMHVILALLNFETISSYFIQCLVSGSNDIYHFKACYDSLTVEIKYNTSLIQTMLIEICIVSSLLVNPYCLSVQILICIINSIISQQKKLTKQFVSFLCLLV